MDYRNNHVTRNVLVVIALLCAALFVVIVSEGSFLSGPSADVSPVPFTTETPAIPRPISNTSSSLPVVEVIASGLKIPWDLAFLPDGGLLVTERAGNLVHIAKSGSSTSISLPHPVPRGEGGLLGVTLHPQFVGNAFVYLYMTTQSGVEGTKNAIYRYRYEAGKLLDEKTIISGISGALYHDGGRMEFGPDGLLYITTGDAQKSDIAQDLKSLGGKILRLTDEGGVPSDNPFGTAVYSYGHRNPQGLTWDSDGRLWSTEHGRSGIVSGLDEINLIEKGKNYGWPIIEGDAVKDGMEVPARHSGSDVTWAPASALYYKGSIFFGGLKGESLYQAVLDGGRVKEVKSHFYHTYGRIRTVRLGPDGMLYLTTSNRDSRGKPVREDDRIIRVDPEQL